MIRGAAGVALALASACAIAHPPGHAPAHRPLPGRDRAVLDNTPLWLELALARQSSPWRTQYLPDDYRLPGYDGAPEGTHFCRGKHSRTLSTAGMAKCPHGEKPDTGTRYLSTDPG